MPSTDSTPAPPSRDPVTLIRAGAIDGFDWASIDGQGRARPGALVVGRQGGVIDAGPTAEMDRRYAADVQKTIQFPDRLILPGMVNAHAHLELTAIGPQPYGGDFIGWVAMLRQHWPGEGEPFAKAPSSAWFAEAAAAGARQSLDAGVYAVGDITRFAEVAQARQDAGLGGVSFIEVFGMGPPWDAEGLATIGRSSATDGVQPHAPYSAGPALFEAACASGRPVSCHLAETRDEARFIAEGDGPFLELLESLGKWSPEFAVHYGLGLSPVQWMEPYLRRAPWLLAHCNYVSDDDIALLADTGASVAYCPIASEYFGHHASGASGASGGVHRYRDMLDAGINVCLGTDSIVCQPPDETQPLGILPQMRRLYQRDQTDPALLLRMATDHGQRSLSRQGDTDVLMAVPFDAAEPTDPLTQTLQRRDAVETIGVPNFEHTESAT
ncbi:MAG: amidohydrolase family protein [Planctomycetota bacterium]